MAQPVPNDACVPFQILLDGTLEDVLRTGTRLEASQQLDAPGCLQLIRYSAGSETYARLVRIEVEITGQGTWRITPQGAADELRILRPIPPGSVVVARLTRGEGVDVSALPDLSAFDVRLEIYG